MQFSFEISRPFEILLESQNTGKYIYIINENKRLQTPLDSGDLSDF